MIIDMLPLSGKIITTLKINAKIYYIDDLIKKSDAQLLLIPKIGKNNLKLIRKSLDLFEKSESIIIEKERYLSDLQLLIHTELIPFKQEINELRTILCEQYRLLQSIQLEKRPEGIVNNINEKLPGFSGIIYDLYKKIENIS